MQLFPCFFCFWFRQTPKKDAVVWFSEEDLELFVIEEFGCSPSDTCSFWRIMGENACSAILDEWLTPVDAFNYHFAVSACSGAEPLLFGVRGLCARAECFLFFPKSGIQPHKQSNHSPQHNSSLNRGFYWWFLFITDIASSMVLNVRSLHRNPFDRLEIRREEKMKWNMMSWISPSLSL